VQAALVETKTVNHKLQQLLNP